MIEELIKKSRSVRRFVKGEKVSMETLRWLVNLARMSPSAANLQPLKYILSNSESKNAKIFPCLHWAGYLKDWNGPAEGERPTAYIIILHDKQISKDLVCDHGIAAQSMMLGAAEKGLAGCMVGHVEREDLRKVLDIPHRYDIYLVLALGRAKEKVVLEDVGKSGNIEYYRDAKDIHHVPKRKLDEIILNQ